MKGVFGNAVWLSVTTFLSRILGFIRDLMLARFLGGGLLMSAWSYAWMIPNMFRRILGEGALGSVFVPVLTETLENQGLESARKKFSTVTLWLFFLLTLITVLFSGGSLIFSCFVEEERWKLAALTIPVVMPYCILICFIGVYTSILNTFRIFVLPAFLSLMPNIFMIGMLYFFLPGLINTPLKALQAISIAMVLSGIIELFFLVIILKRKQMLPEFSKKVLLNFSVIREIWVKLLPGLIGACALQIGSYIDGTLAMKISDHAKSAMYYSDRLVYLPIGLFGVAFGTVSLPFLSKLVVNGRMKSMLISTFTSIRQMFFITIPVTVLMVLFSKELLYLVFYGGKFGMAELNEAHRAMFWYSLGIPFFCLTKMSVNTFYCRKDMKTPAVISICCICLNIILSIILMTPMKQGGITLATALTSALNNIVLLYILRKQFGRMPLAGTVKFTLLILMISVISGGAAFFCHRWLLGHPAWHVLPRGIVPLFGAGLTFAAVFVFLCLLFRVRELRAFVDRFKGKIKRKKA